jgi:hypothetical protein
MRCVSVINSDCIHVQESDCGLFEERLGESEENDEKPRSG